MLARGKSSSAVERKDTGCMRYCHGSKNAAGTGIGVNYALVPIPVPDIPFLDNNNPE